MTTWLICPPCRLTLLRSVMMNACTSFTNNEMGHAKCLQLFCMYPGLQGPAPALINISDLVDLWIYKVIGRLTALRCPFHNIGNADQQTREQNHALHSLHQSVMCALTSSSRQSYEVCCLSVCRYSRPALTLSSCTWIRAAGSIRIDIGCLTHCGDLISAQSP